MITISSAAADLLENGLDKTRTGLGAEAEDLSMDTSKTVLSRARAVSHAIPSIDEYKVYRFRPSKCLEGFGEQCMDKRPPYLRTEWRRTATGTSTIPLLMIPKVSSAGGSL